MKEFIRGFVDVEFLYPDGKREMVVSNLENHVNWYALRRYGMYLGQTNMAMPTKRDATSIISGTSDRWVIATSPREISNDMFQLFSHAGSEVFNVNQDYPTYQDGATANDPDLVTFVATVTAPSVTPRTIKSIGLKEQQYTTPTTSTLSGGYFTLLNLTSPCVQPVNVIVILTYRLFLQPAVEQNLANKRASATTFKRFKTRLKQACNAVNSTNLYISQLDRTITSSSYDYDDIDSFAVSGSAKNTTNSNIATDKGLQTLNPTQLRNLNSIRYGGTLATTLAPYDGLFIKKIALVGNDANDQVHYATGVVYNHVLGNSNSPLQNIFPQRNSPPGPFQDLTVNNTATMSGSITLDASVWQDPKHQQLVKFVFNSSGPVGTATYTLEVMNFIAGFMGNTWLPRTALLPQPLGNDSYFQKDSNDVSYVETIWSGASVMRNVDDDRLVAVGSVTRTMAGINVYDVIAGSRLTFNSSNGLSVSAVSDVETSNGYIFVACANTGLWRISPDLSTVEHLPSPSGTEKAYQISVKRDVNKTIWVLFDGGVYKLSNPTAAVGSLTWTNYPFTYAGITDSNWANVTSMVIDPDYVGVSDRFLFVTGTLTGGSTAANHRLGYVWWDTANNTANNPASNGADGPITWNLSNMLKMSDLISCADGIWTFPRTIPNNVQVNGYTQNIYVATFNQANLTAKTVSVDTRYARLIPVTINGVRGFVGSDCYTPDDRQSMYFVTTAAIAALPNGNNNITNAAALEFYLLDGAHAYSATVKNVQEEGYLSRPLTYLPNSNFFVTYEAFSNKFGVCPFVLPPTHAKFATYKNAMWKSYGWDSLNSVWLLNEPTGRLTHGTLETIDVLNDIQVSFNNGVSGVSFVDTEWFITTLGNGLMKDNGTSYTFNFSFSFYPTETITQSTNVPQTPLGLLTDAPVTFLPLNNTTSETNITDAILQSNGKITIRSYGNGSNIYISDQLIPTSTDFEFGFKFLDYPIDDGGNALMGIATYSGGNYTYGLNFRYFSSNDTLRVYNADTLLASITAPQLGVELMIKRVGSTINCWHDGNVIAGTTVTNSSQYVIEIHSKNAAYASFKDMRLTYTENRRVLSLVDIQTPPNDKFSSLTYGAEAGDVKVLIGSGSPLTANLLYTSSAVPITGTGYVKVAPAAGWLIFHDSEAANPVNIKAVAQYLPF